MHSRSAFSFPPRARREQFSTADELPELPFREQLEKFRTEELIQATSAALSLSEDAVLGSTDISIAARRAMQGSKEVLSGVVNPRALHWPSGYPRAIPPQTANEPSLAQRIHGHILVSPDAGNVMLVFAEPDEAADFIMPDMSIEREDAALFRSGLPDREWLSKHFQAAREEWGLPSDSIHREYVLDHFDHDEDGLVYNEIIISNEPERMSIVETAEASPSSSIDSVSGCATDSLPSTSVTPTNEVTFGTLHFQDELSDTGIVDERLSGSIVETHAITSTTSDIGIALAPFAASQIGASSEPERADSLEARVASRNTFTESMTGSVILGFGDTLATSSSNAGRDALDTDVFNTDTEIRKAMSAEIIPHNAPDTASGFTNVEAQEVGPMASTAPPTFCDSQLLDTYRSSEASQHNEGTEARTASETPSLGGPSGSTSGESCADPPTPLDGHAILEENDGDKTSAEAELDEDPIDAQTAGTFICFIPLKNGEECHAILPLNANTIRDHISDGAAGHDPKRTHCVDECPHTFSGEYAATTFRRHVLSHHAGIEFYCEHCGNQYKRMDEVRRHEKVKGNCRFCTFCETLFDDVKTRRSHQKAGGSACSERAAACAAVEAAAVEKRKRRKEEKKRREEEGGKEKDKKDKEEKRKKNGEGRRTKRGAG